MKYIILSFLLIACKNKQTSNIPENRRLYTTTDHMGMRAITTKPYNDSLGCKNGHLWKLVKDDDWVDIGQITDSCNCNNHDTFEPPHKPGNQEILYVLLAVTDSSIFLPNGLPAFVKYEDSLGKINHISKDGLGTLSLNSFPQILKARGFKITIQKLDTIMPEGNWSMGKN